MSDQLAQQILKEMQEIRAELKEVRSVLFDDADALDSLDNYEHPDVILTAYQQAVAKHGTPRTDVS